MRLLVIGRTGQLARALAARAAPDLAVTCLGRETADLAHPEACGQVVAGAGADAVINAAAFTAVDRAEAEAALALTINAEAPGAMARAAAARGLPFLHVSTDYVFDGAPGRAWREEDAPAPLNAYGRSKLAGERAVLAAGGRGLVLRTSWVFSATGTNFVKTMLRLGRERAEIGVVDDQRGGPTPADALADALLVMARGLAGGSGGAGGEAGLFHFAGAPETSWAGFAAEIMARAGLAARIKKIPSSAYPTPAKRPLNSALDCSRIARVWGLAQPDWRAGLDRVLRTLGEGG
jgi:dTDP-4-dehydrorhamnose reductase